MDSKQVEILIEKYWEGSSSLEEEQQIRNFYLKDELPDHLEMYREVFSENEFSIVPELGSDFDEKLISRIEDKRTSSSWVIFRVAAVAFVLIISAVSVYKLDNASMQLAEDTVETPQDALEETKKAFLLIAEALNKGEEQAMALAKLDETNQKLKHNKD